MSRYCLLALFSVTVPATGGCSAGHVTTGSEGVKSTALAVGGAANCSTRPGPAAFYQGAPTLFGVELNPTNGNGSILEPLTGGVFATLNTELVNGGPASNAAVGDGMGPGFTLSANASINVQSDGSYEFQGGDDFYVKYNGSGSSTVPTDMATVAVVGNTIVRTLPNGDREIYSPAQQAQACTALACAGTPN